MKRLLLGFLCFGAMGLLTLSSCQKAPELTITSPASIELSADGSNGTITFTANRGWTASSSDSWVTVSPSSGEASDKPVTVTVRSNANTTYDDRTATVTIRMEELSQTITVRQPANLGIIVPTQAFVLTSEGRTIDVEVQANVQYTVDISVDWIRQPGTKGLTSTKYSFSIAENTTYDDREGKITIKSQNTSVPDQIITVKQAQKDAILVKDTSFDMPYGGGEIEFKVEANVAFDVKSTADWLHYVGTKGLSSSTLKLTVDENTTYDTREGKVEITQQNGSIKHTVTVNQAGRIAVTSVELDQTSLTLKPEETATLIATVQPDNATDKTVTWTTSDPEIATVDETGKVTAIKDGIATITAKAGEKTTTCEVKVSSSVYVGNAVDLGIIITREDGSAYKLLWADCNLGTDKPEGYGDYYAWGETEEKEDYSWETYKFRTSGDSSDNVQFSKYNTNESFGPVDNKTVLDPEDDVAYVKLGGKWRMPTNAEWTALLNSDNCTWLWTTQNGVYGRLVTSNKNGNSIFLSAAGYRGGTHLSSTGSRGYYWSSISTYPTASLCIFFSLDKLYIAAPLRCEGQPVRPVMEVEIPVTSIELNKTSFELGVGETETLVATIKPENATDKTVTWTSSDSSIASVDNTGKVTAIKEGTATITAKAGEKTAECQVTVCIPVTSIELDKTELSLEQGKTATLTATVKPDNATDKTVTWTSSNSEIATVDNTGKVTVIKEGVATITAKAGEKSASCSVVVYNKVPDGAVDLGIIMTRDDGSKYCLFWAECNIGASKPEEYGDYYAWGETETWTLESYKWATTNVYNMTKYCPTDKADYWYGTGSPDGKTVLDPEDDVAHVKLGGKWRIPTDAEWTELRNKCTWTWTTQNGVNGRLVTSKNNGNSIFLPAAGCDLLYEVGSDGYYWSSSLDLGYPMGAMLEHFDSGEIFMCYGYRCYGLPVRPVTD